MPTAPIVSGSYGRPTSAGRMGPIYQYGSALPYGPYSGLPRASTAPGAGGRTGTSTTTASSGPTAEAQQFLNQVLTGQQLPFSPERITQMKSAASDRNAAGEAALNSRIDQTAAMGGASATDPSLQGARLNTMARRQTANQTAARDIEEGAAGANFDAKMRAAGMLEQSRMQSEALQNQLSQRALGYMPWSQGGGGSMGARSQEPGLLEYQGARYGSYNSPSYNPHRTSDYWRWNAQVNNMGGDEFDQYMEDFLLG